MIKLYFIESIADIESINNDEYENVQSINKNVQSTDSFENENQNLASEISTKLTRARRLLLRYQNFADITVFLQDKDESSLIFVLISILTFAESRRKKSTIC